MDRLETLLKVEILTRTEIFIFQYGQIRNAGRTFVKDSNGNIYIPVWIDQKLIEYQNNKELKNNLYSSMDRLENFMTVKVKTAVTAFIFQYGQIRNSNR